MNSPLRPVNTLPQAACRRRSRSYISGNSIEPLVEMQRKLSILNSVRHTARGMRHAAKYEPAFFSHMKFDFISGVVVKMALSMSFHYIRYHYIGEVTIELGGLKPPPPRKFKITTEF